jgi:hypothetical protein
VSKALGATTALEDCATDRIRTAPGPLGRERSIVRRIKKDTCRPGVIAARSRTVYMVVSMDSLTIFGLFAVGLLYARGAQHLLHSLLCRRLRAGSIYGFLRRAVRNRRSHLGSRRRATLVVQEKSLVGHVSSTRLRLDAYVSASEELTPGGRPHGFGRLARRSLAALGMVATQPCDACSTPRRLDG